ncbi:MAG TPA: DUF2188 domain-containing protein [Cytophagaceae bacterium]|jgi:uncharacterized protein YdaT
MHSTSKNNFIPSINLLRQEVRVKAIQIANILVCNKFDKDVAYTIAFENARIIANNKMETENIFHLVHHAEEGWTLVSTDGQATYFSDKNKKSALIKARCYAKSRKGKLYIHSEIGLVSDNENFKVNRPMSGPLQELVCNEQNKWALKKAGSDKSFIFDDKREALKKAKVWAKEKRSKLLVKNEFGKVERTYSYEIGTNKEHLG